ncbi:MAG: hypothetical protein KJ731_00140 [Alphaproteobacteria bacterium]|jgi:hypothetical protein|uniref:EamA-like transporter family protein n=1 Tax=Celeribacter baekdonensis TaxID=875171 RepID=A0A1G7FR39_9RHOB|nr:hypothetical protein [Celeribacter baekdonensis]MBU0645313.1 hypothetical protein [Alphaproteobacteria bacterium]MBU1279098.1 hypothetical protein [Alphaproteobacteria bacterium]MBU1575481.1 hypothetical protein [Alphaproteobacteria bacterium]MBU1826885.1 hypothetical protein [Alphaproteobacteria bacterium]MBU2079561.1 hypothetical protein [Alphaproteobacteria bacterium]
MTTRGLLIQTLIATVLWGLGMVLVFDWPRAEILKPMVFFAAVYWGIGRIIGLILAKRSQK